MTPEPEMKPEAGEGAVLDGESVAENAPVSGRHFRRHNMPEPGPRLSGGRFQNTYFDGLPLSEAQVILFCLMMLVYFFQQYCNWSFTFLAPAFVRTLELGTSEGYRFISTVGVSFFLGQSLGAAITGVLSDRCGRRFMLLVSLVVFSVAGMLNGLAGEQWSFILTRGLTGYGLLSVMVVTNAYLAEITPARSRGKWQGIIATVGFTAAPLVAVLSWATVPIAPEAWRYILYAGGLGLLPFFLALGFLKESPRWLLGRGRLAEAEIVMRQLSGRDIDLSHLWDNRQALSVRGALGMLFGRAYRARFLAQLALYGITTPAIFLQLLWPTSLLDAELGLERALWISACITMAVPVGCLPAAYLMDSLGRGRCLMVQLALAGFGSLGYGYCPADSAFLIPFGIINVLGIMGATFVMFTYTAESFPTRIRNTAVGMAQGFGRLIIVLFQFPAFWIAEAYGRPGFYIISGILLLLPIPLLIFSSEDTTGKSLEDLHSER